MTCAGFYVFVFYLCSVMLWLVLFDADTRKYKTLEAAAAARTPPTAPPDGVGQITWPPVPI